MVEVESEKSWTPDQKGEESLYLKEKIDQVVGRKIRGLRSKDVLVKSTEGREKGNGG